MKLLAMRPPVCGTTGSRARNYRAPSVVFGVDGPSVLVGTAGRSAGRRPVMMVDIGNAEKDT